MKVWFMLIALFLLILGESLLGAVAVAVPLTLMGIVWFAAVWGWHYGLGGAAAGGWLIAALSGHAALGAVMFAAAAATCWRCGREQALEHTPGWRTGLWVGLTVFAGVLLSHPAAAVRLFASPAAAGTTLLRLASCLVFSMALYPVVAEILKCAAAWFGLPCARPVRGRTGR